MKRQFHKKSITKDILCRLLTVDKRHEFKGYNMSEFNKTKQKDKHKCSTFIRATSKTGKRMNTVSIGVAIYKLPSALPQS